METTRETKRRVRRRKRANWAKSPRRGARGTTKTKTKGLRTTSGMVLARMGRTRKTVRWFYTSYL